MEEPVFVIKKQLHLTSPSQVLEYKFDWTVENFSFHEDSLYNYGYLNSPLVQTKDKKYSWRLGLYSQRESIYSKAYVSVYLVNESTKKDVTSKVTISCLNCPTILQKCEFTMKPGVGGSGFEKLVSREDLFKDPGFLSTDCLTVFCEIKVLEHLSEEACEGLPSRKMVSLSEDFGCLLKNKCFCDATILVGKREFKVHKVILSARSTVFAAMFSNNFEETQTNIIKIVDTSPRIMKEVIHYIYTDKCPRLKDFVEDLLPIADKYALSGLKDLCVDELYSLLNICNAAHILLLADLYSATHLKESVTEFIVMNSRAVVATPTWIEMIASKHPLIAEVIFSKLPLSKGSLYSLCKFCYYSNDPISSYIVDFIFSFFNWVAQ